MSVELGYQVYSKLLKRHDSLIISIITTLLAPEMTNTPIKICPHHLHFFLISMLLLILFSVYFSNFVSVRLTTSHCVSNLHNLVGEKQGFQQASNKYGTKMS